MSRCRRLGVDLLGYGSLPFGTLSPTGLTRYQLLYPNRECTNLDKSAIWYLGAIRATGQRSRFAPNSMLDFQRLTKLKLKTCASRRRQQPTLQCLRARAECADLSAYDTIAAFDPRVFRLK